ncbi:MAG: hypothetical protein WCI02_02670 [Planctomycetota bacterium]
MTTRLDQRWGPDAPDFRDISVDSERASELWRYLSIVGDPATSVDFRDEFLFEWEPDDSSCQVSHACCSVLEYFLAQSEGSLVRLSRKFVARSARLFEGPSTHADLSIRAALRSIRRTGLPPHTLVRNVEQSGMTAESSPLCYAFASDYSDLVYVRIDRSDVRETLKLMKRLLNAWIPCIVGLSFPSTLPWTSELQLRDRFDKITDRGVIVLCGYEDHSKWHGEGTFTFHGPFPSTWGEKGFGTMHYSYLLQGMASDIWVAFKSDWLKKMTQNRRLGTPSD